MILICVLVPHKRRIPSRSGHLSNQGAGSGALVSPGGREDTDGLVVTRETVDTGLDENEAELAVLVLAVALKVLADGDSLLDEEVEVLRDLRSEAYNKSHSVSLVFDQAEAEILFFSCQIDTVVYDYRYSS